MGVENKSEGFENFCVENSLIHLQLETGENLL